MENPIYVQVTTLVLSDFGEIGYKLFDLTQKYEKKAPIMDNEQQKEFTDILSLWINDKTIPFKDKLKALHHILQSTLTWDDGEEMIWEFEV